jgi:hypothetical protein
MALLEEIITETRKEVVGRIFSPKVDHITKIGKEVVGIIIFSKSSLDHRDRKGGCGEIFFSKSRLEASSFMRLSTNDFFCFFFRKTAKC